jgi:hypothetical protein
MVAISESLIQQSLFEAQSLYALVQQDIASTLQNSSIIMPNAIPTLIQRAVDAYRPVLISHLTASKLSSWILGADQVAKQFPEWLLREFSTGVRSDRNPPSWFQEETQEASDPEPRFSIILNAMERLSERNIISREQWDLASDVAQQNAFMITGEITLDTIERVRDELIQDLSTGTSLGGFKNRVGEILEKSGLGDARIETIYRTNVQSAFRDGRETIARDPLVMEAFPYQAYLAIHDARVRSNHLALESLGLSGTNIYRRDDPFWDYWTPPNGFNCRCGVQLMTVEQAAAAGVEEAIRWLESGRPPERPEHRLNYIPFEPEPGFGFRGRYGAMVA